VEQVERAANFKRAKGGFEVRERARGQISFRVHNLAAGTPLVPNSPDLAWDGILCRNVLIYFADVVRQRVIAEFEEMLIPGGVLLLSSSESLGGLKTSLRARHMHGGFLFVRESAPHLPPASLPPSSTATQATAPAAARPPTSVASDAFQASWHNHSASKHWLEHGSECLRRHAFDEARAYYQKAVALDGVSFEPYLLLAIVDLKQSALEPAKASLRSALFLEPRCWPGEYLLAGVLAREGREAEQGAALRRAEALLSRGDDLTYTCDVSGIEPLCYTREQALSVCRARLHAMKKGLLK
jgi:tetratricopeptide (TPR) repeat protein